ncbi:MAG: NAD-dependent epimerase/dehydratase family protein [Gallionella sp.]|nr:NAD-dependent epimerase/dehydratase family protein [Gallionella sp.]
MRILEATLGKIPDDVKAMLGLEPEAPITQSSVLSPRDSVVLWGTGTPRREFLYVDDLANALVFLAMLDDERYNALVAPDQCPLINVGTGVDLTIRELAETVAQVVGYQGKFVQDTSKPDGTMRKVMDVTRMHELGWREKVGLREGIATAYAEFYQREDSR